MTNNLSDNYFPNLDISLNQIKRFKETIGFFSMLLEDGSIVHHSPEDKERFRNWLLTNEVPEIK